MAINILPLKKEINLKVVSSIMDSLTEGIAYFAQSDWVIYSNPSFTKMTGLPIEGFSIDQFINIIKSNDPEIFKQVLLSLEKQQTIHINEVKILQQYYEMYIIPVKTSKNEFLGVSIILHDISRLKELDTLKSEFVSIASHQLKTPLSSMSWYLELLLDEKLTEQQLDYIKEVTKANDRLKELVNDLLNVSRLESGMLKIEPKNINIKDFISDIIKEVLPAAKLNNIKIIYNQTNNISEISIDPILGRQIFHNLLTNAVKYSHPKSTVYVNVDYSTNSKYVFSVKNTGFGIPKESQNKIFDKFYRAENAQSAVSDGTGLGLFLVKMITDQSGGKIWFESNPKETTFFIEFPPGGMLNKAGTKTII